jgi:hypothetical protein
VEDMETYRLKFSNNTSYELRLEPYFDHVENTTDQLPPHNMHNSSEKGISRNSIVVFGLPVMIPDLSMYYKANIEVNYDPRITKIIEKLVYLNPVGNEVIRKKMATLIVKRYSRYVKTESDTQIGKEIFKPVLNHEKVLSMVEGMYGMGPNENACDKQMYHLYFSNNDYPSELKRKISNEIRRLVNKSFLGLIIDNAVDSLIEYDQYTRITTKRIHGHEIIKASQKLKSYNTVNKNMTEYAKRRIEETNTMRHFTNEELTQKLVTYLSDERKSADAIVKEYSISKNSALIFNKIRNESPFNNSTDCT